MMFQILFPERKAFLEFMYRSTYFVKLSYVYLNYSANCLIKTRREKFHETEWMADLHLSEVER